MLNIPQLPFKVEEISDRHPVVVKAHRLRGAEEKCWCQSGKKYKKCHQGKSTQEPPRLREVLAVTHRIFWRREKCSHPRANHGDCEGKIINAHSIQRKGVLEKITQKHHVLQLDIDPNSPKKINVKKISWKKASTFPGFCTGHDSTIFQRIEVTPFVGDHDQCVLQAYRNVCNEQYKKYGLLDTLRYQKDVFDKGMSLNEQISYQISVNRSIENSTKSLEEMETIKKKYEEALFAKKLDSFSSKCYFFTGDFGVVSSGIMHTEYTFDGKRLADIWDLTKYADCITHSVMATPSGGAFFLLGIFV